MTRRNDARLVFFMPLFFCAQIKVKVAEKPQKVMKTRTSLALVRLAMKSNPAKFGFATLKNHGAEV